MAAKQKMSPVKFAKFAIGSPTGFKSSILMRMQGLIVLL